MKKGGEFSDEELDMLKQFNGHTQNAMNYETNYELWNNEMPLSQHVSNISSIKAMMGERDCITTAELGDQTTEEQDDTIAKAEMQDKMENLLRQYLTRDKGVQK